jgi:succinyl-diaminopimelate desuccinylase
MEKFQNISRRIDRYRNAMVDLQIKLCANPAVSPESGGEGESKKSSVLLDFIKDCGFYEVNVIEAPDLEVPSGCRPNILARFKGGHPGKTIWVMTHMDVVPPGDLAQWDGNPFKAWVEGGKIFGRGVEDNQQDMVASLFAMKAFHEEGIKPHYNVGIALVSDEETGSQKGIRYVLDNANPFAPSDLVIVPDSGNSQGSQIEVAEKSVLWLKIKTTGRQTHGSTPEKGINSFKAASHLIVELEKLYGLFHRKNALFDPPVSTFEPTKKESNVPNINTIPGEDVFYVDCRVLPDYATSDVTRKIRELAAFVANKMGVAVDVEILQDESAPPPTPAKAPVVLALKKAVKQVYGIEAEAVGIGGGTVASHFRRAGFEAACWSKCDETAHQPNEYCVIENMLGDAKVFSHVFLQE